MTGCLWLLNKSLCVRNNCKPNVTDQLCLRIAVDDCVCVCVCACVRACVCACVRACVHACGGCVCGMCVAGCVWCVCGARVVRVTLVTDWVGQRQWMKTKFNVKNEYVRMPMKTNELHYDVFIWSSVLVIHPSVLQAIKCWQNRHQIASFGVSTFNIHARPGFSEKSG